MAENEQHEPKTDTGGKPEPRQKNNRPKATPLTARQKRFRRLFHKVSPYVVAAWPTAQAIWGYLSGYWKETWFIVTFLSAVFLVACFGCWWCSWQWLRSTGVALLAASILSIAGFQWHKRIPAEPLSGPIAGTEFKHSDVKHIFPYDYGLISLEEGKPLRHEEFRGETNKFLNWKIDWKHITAEPDVAAGKVVFGIPVRTDGPNLALSLGTGYTTLTITAQLKTGAMATPPVVFHNKPVLYVCTLSDNQRKPVFAVGFRITSPEDVERIMKANQK